MPIRPFLNGERFDPETTRVLGVAFEMVCVALRTGDCDDVVRQAIATKIIDLAKVGERNPDLLCEQVLKDIRGPQVDHSCGDAARESTGRSPPQSEAQGSALMAAAPRAYQG
jgi:hypothetical protein